MADPLLHVGATVQCAHGGMTTLTTTNSRVLLNKQPAITVADLGMVAGCPFMAGNVYSPCVTVRYLMPAKRVFIGGQPAVLSQSTGLTQSAAQVPQGPPHTLLSQVRTGGT